MNKEALTSYRNTILSWVLGGVISIVCGYNAGLSAIEKKTAVIETKQEECSRDRAEWKQDIKDIKNSINDIKTSMAVLAATKKDK